MGLGDFGLFVGRRDGGRLPKTRERHPRFWDPAPLWRFAVLGRGGGFAVFGFWQILKSDFWGRAEKVGDQNSVKIEKAASAARAG